LLGGLTGSVSSNVGIYGACSTNSFTAILTDGNIVQVFFNASTNEPSFRILSPTGTVVVATTSISATFLLSGTPNIAVTALTGGGFAVAWINSAGGTSGRPCYAVYSNAGVVVSIAQQDLGGTNTSNAAYPIRIKATPSGGFIIAYYAVTGTATNARGYAANGTAAFSWVNLTTAAGGNIIGLAVRSDGSFLLTGGATSTSTVYAIWSSVGVAIVGTTSFASTAGTFNGFTDATCLSDGTTFVIVTSNAIGGQTTIAFRFLPTGNVLGSEFYIPAGNYTGGAGGSTQIVGVTPLSDGKFIIGTGLGAGTGAGYNGYFYCYAVFDSTGTCLSGTTAGTASTAARPVLIPQTFITSALYLSFLPSPAGYITAYYPPAAGSNNAFAMLSSTIDATTYQVINVTPSTQVVGSVTGTPTVYAPSGSAPLSASFGIAAGTYFAGSALGTIVKSPEIVNAGNVGSVATTTLPDGRVLIAYILSSGNVVNVAVYSITGAFIQTISIATNGTSTLQQFSKVCISALTSGKFVIAYASGSTTYAVKLYSSTFTQIGSDVNVTCPGGVSSNYGASVSGLTGDRYIIVYSGTTNYPYYRVYDNTNTQLVGDTLINAVDMKDLTVCGFSTGGFFVSGRYTTNIQYSSTFTNSSGNTFAVQVAFNQVTGSATPLQNGRAVANSSGVVFMPYSNAATSVVSYGANVTAFSSWNPAPQLTGLTTVDGTGMGVNGFGMPVAVSRIGSVLQMYVYGTSVALSTTLVPYTTANSSQVSLTPSYGYNVGIAYIDNNQKLNYAILCGAYNSTQSATLTSTDPSTAINIYPGTTSASPAIQNTVFTGVALQTVPAGGAGLVQVNGTAQLGSTYPSTTTYRAFDHQGQGVPGVKGTIVGRAITLQGT
jgi:hypothetical protein